MQTLTSELQRLRAQLAEKEAAAERILETVAESFWVLEAVAENFWGEDWRRLETPSDEPLRERVAAALSNSHRAAVSLAELVTALREFRAAWQEDQRHPFRNTLNAAKSSLALQEADERLRALEKQKKT